MPIPLETMLDQVSTETRNAIDASTRAIIADNRARYDGTDGRHRGPPHLAEAVFRWSLRHADRAAILMERLDDVRSLADRALVAGRGAPWEEAGRLIARFHRAGLDHADLNAHNILFDANGRGWLIDFDRGVLRIPATRWRERNLKRLLRSLLKLRGERSREDVEKDFARLRRAYDLAWNRGV